MNHLIKRRHCHGSPVSHVKLVACSFEISIELRKQSFVLLDRNFFCLFLICLRTKRGLGCNKTKKQRSESGEIS